MTARQFRLEDRYQSSTNQIFLSGIQALARLPLEQARLDREIGWNTAGFISGYRGSPLGGLDKELWRISKLLTEHNVVFQPGINEELAATAVWGSQQVGLFQGARYDGVFGLWYGKAPGLDRACDAVRHANAAGTSPKGGVLLAVGDDHGCKSSTLPSHSEWALADLGLPILNPANVEDVLRFGLLGWAMSRYSGLWVSLIALADNMDSAMSIDLAAIPRSFITPELADPAGGVSIRAADQALAQEERLLRIKLPRAMAFARANDVNRTIFRASRPELAIVAGGKAYMDVRQALVELGLGTENARQRAGVSLLKVGMPWPLDPETVRDFALGHRNVLVVEEKRPIVEDQVKNALYGLTNAPQVAGKRTLGGTQQLPSFGEISPMVVAQAIAALLPTDALGEHSHDYLSLMERRQQAIQVSERRGNRTPVFCSGCPHNTSTRLPEDSRAVAGIGCHYMAQWIVPNTQTFTQMGGEGVPWIGQAPFTDEQHVFANLGDGTYFHSGILAIRAAVAAGVNITYKILLNDAVAMTGGQPVDGQLSLEDLIRQVEAEGVKRIDVVTGDGERPAGGKVLGRSIHARGTLDSLQRDMRTTAGCSVLIYQQPCATELRRKRKRGQVAESPRRILINDAVCEGCGDCTVQSGCVSVEPLVTEMGMKRTINQTTCNQDFSCVRGFCPSFVSVYDAHPKRRTAIAGEYQTLRSRTPLPDVPQVTDPVNIVITGVGGTGIVTMSQLIGVAAHLDGHAASTLDMTGLAQKGGAVFSHIRIGAERADLHATRVSTGRADLLLAADVITGSGSEALSLLNPDETVAVVNSHLMPTANFLLRQRADLDSASWIDRVRGHVQAVHQVDANGLSERFLGDAMMTNVLLMGFAFQKGLLPISLDAMESAISMNGVAVQDNLYAFHFGRWAAHAPDDIDRSVTDHLGVMEPPIAQTVEELIESRAQTLTDYQNADYADQYRRLLARVSVADAAVGGTVRRQPSLTELVARNLFKVMAYKDEYEVARLFGDGRFKQRLQDTFEGGYRLAFHLAPPMLERRDDGRPGFPRKRTFGGWMLPAFALLRHGKRLRGTSLDVFGYFAERRRERAWRDRYITALEGILALPLGEHYERATKIAALPARVGGYGPIKIKAMNAAEAELAQLTAELSKPTNRKRQAA